jgi:hypothetical protein
VTDTAALPLSNDDQVFVRFVRRPPVVRRCGLIRDYGPWRSGDPMMMIGVDEIPSENGTIYEVTVHRRKPTSDDRCVVARFRSIMDVKACILLLAETWFMAYDGLPPSDTRQHGSEPCVN